MQLLRQVWGGIRDATNVFGSQQLLLAIITALGLEHQAALGQFYYILPPSKHVGQDNLEHQIFEQNQEPSNQGITESMF